MGIFKFKRFSIDDTLCAMKTGTDAVLLGAWFPLLHGSLLLDIGCGSGIISLMTAQREPTLTIHAIEIDPSAAKQARINVLHSPFAGNIRIITGDANHYCWNSISPFHHIICNPPYFRNSLKSSDREKNLARHDVSLTHHDVLKLILQHLHTDGSAGIIIPYSSSKEFVFKALTMGLFVRNQLIVRHTAAKPASRVLLELVRKRPPIQQTKTINICNDDHTWSDDYKSLTRDFYIHL